MENVTLVNSTLQMLLRSLDPSRERAMVSRWKEEFERHSTRLEQKNKILAAIAHGYNSYAEIVAETQIPRSTVMKTMDRLLRDNSVKKTLFQKPNKRTELHFEIINKK